MSLIKNRIKKAQQAKSPVSLAVNSAVNEKPVASNQQSSAYPERDGLMNEFDMFKIALDADLAQLKQFSDIEEKNQYKADALKNNEYLTYIEQYQKQGANHPNIVLAWVFIWLVDLNRWEQALNLLPLLIEQQQPLPTQFNTKHWGDFFIDQLYDHGNKQLAKGRETILKTNVITLFTKFFYLLEQNTWVINDVCKGKIFAMGHKLEAANFNYGNALNYGLIALAANAQAGVKKTTKEIAKQLNIEIEI